jgi:REP element-mobilizing transposase RayT
MGRRPRIEVPGGYYHVHTRGNDRQDIYFGNWSGRLFLRELERAVGRFEWRILAYCLMPNHYHVVMQIGDAGLSDGMSELNGRYAKISNWKNRRINHLFGKRFSSWLIEDDDYLFEVLRYVVLNPVRARMVRHAWRWRWSSMRPTLGLDPPRQLLDVDWLLSHFSDDAAAAPSVFARWVAAGVGLPAPWHRPGAPAA